MLQQTRVETVIPYYLAFLAKFPTAAALAAASESDVLTAWAGLGYYSRARNLRLAATEIAAASPCTHEEVLRLRGIGPYTAAALASISFGQPHAAVDGNVMRVISRLTNDPSEISSGTAKKRFSEIAGQLLDPKRPGDFNQAMMELGATVCVPGNPTCLLCPVQKFCAAQQAGTQRDLPVKLGKSPANKVELDLLICSVDGQLCLIRRSASERRLAGFWELPEKIPRLASTLIAEFTHQIVQDRFHVRVWTSYPRQRPAHLKESTWFTPDALPGLPLSTITRKALARIASR